MTETRKAHGRRRADTPSTWTGMLVTLPPRTLDPETVDAAAPGRSRRAGDVRRGIRPGVFVGLGTAALAIMAVTTLAILPNVLSEASAQTQAAEPPAQSLDIAAAAPLAAVPRDTYTADPGVDTYVAGGTNRDWASLVLLYGGWPVTESNVTVMMRWMRQENYEKSWWNRNNPLNNGWGSGGGSGLGSYPNLRVAAQNAAEALHTHPGYAGIRDGFAASAPTEVIEAAIWASPWASSHYHNGAHWHYTPTQTIKAPADAW
ncbi:hypothetical protein OH146_09230 [Salinibacterium sp. SYSU T00001]|uniref:hypothetical protein n=1 Tax=Homoserinimonas sedimenticola TaxID=2986805 RepID=UPI00223676FE|nr:hypothetical protein [Salinibacterium sedimenticola]MCW4385954.1 hypothetical protein [Salinibacterium sedimenticola]